MTPFVCQNYYRTFAKIDLDAIESNFAELKKRVKSGVKICAVVKADAYGHGAVQVANLLKDKVDFFAVAALEEALVLREAGITNPILILAYSCPSQFETLITHNIIPTIYDFNDAQRFSKAAERLGKKVPVHLAVDTGMSRIGFKPNEESADIVKQISLLPSIELQGLFSHYAKADYADKAAANLQTEKFDAFIEMLEKRNVNIPIKHICNSAGIIDFNKQYDMVRMGISLYGMYPSDEVKKERVSLTPAMEVISHIIHVHEIEEGVGVGYGHTYITDRERKIATVSIGYADGYNRCLSNKGWVLIHGKRAPITGKVCMDQIMVDVTDIPDVAVGDQAVIMGKSGDDEISAELLGSLCHSFDYEVVCTFMPRVKRIYLRNGVVVSE
ncbi:MAG: alanine racemase [Ruminococcus sp.]|nr:alanine racemase [Ruminococcus sp.]